MNKFKSSIRMGNVINFYTNLFDEDIINNNDFIFEGDFDTQSNVTEYYLFPMDCFVYSFSIDPNISSIMDVGKSYLFFKNNQKHFTDSQKWKHTPNPWMGEIIVFKGVKPRSIVGLYESKTRLIGDVPVHDRRAQKEFVKNKNVYEGYLDRWDEPLKGVEKKYIDPEHAK